jgi:hypothetical protein
MWTHVMLIEAAIVYPITIPNRLRCWNIPQNVTLAPPAEYILVHIIPHVFRGIFVHGYKILLYYSIKLYDCGKKILLYMNHTV